eukprot:g26612.t1
MRRFWKPLCTAVVLTVCAGSIAPVCAETKVDTSPLPLKSEVAFPKLKWTGWSPVNDRGLPTPLRPIVVTHANDDSNRLFVATQRGVVHVFPNRQDAKKTKVFLNIQKKVVYKDKQNEEGLLGLAFHPKYKTDGRVFVYYTTTDAPHTSVISSFRVSKNDPNRADPASEVEIMRVKQPFWNHNGGTLAFGPDGFLYIALGDGGSANDPLKNGQNLKTLLGSVLRIDIDHKSNGRNYAIPKDNPFVGRGSQARGEIYAYGLRNIWRMSFDRKTGKLWAGDVGQKLWEEIDIIEKGGNYGWNIREGLHPFASKSKAAAKGMIDPIWEYSHEIGKSITGGHVYRGKRLPVLQGKYVYADYVAGKIWALDYDADAKKVVGNHEIPGNKLPVITFGEDEAGEIYFCIVSPNGRGIHRLAAGNGTALLVRINHDTGPANAGRLKRLCFMSTSVDSPFVRLHPDDNILIAKTGVPKGVEFEADESGTRVVTQDLIDLGHKVAVTAIAEGEPVRKFGQLIGFATEAIEPGEWIHSHNLAAGELSLDYAYSSAVPPDPEPIEGRTFLGYRRSDGRAATRNYIGIICSVNCSSTTAKFVAEAFDEALLADYPNIDGVIPLAHKGGCAMQYDGEDHHQLARVLSGFARHPNIAAYLVIGLGCETAQASFLVDNYNLTQLELPGSSNNSADKRPLVLSIQDTGGVAKTVDRAIGALKEMLPDVNRVERVPIPVSELILGTECGGSDGNSGVTANPALGIASDLIVAHGGTTILGETSEIYGGEHILTRRAATREIGEKLVERIRWWEEYAGKFGVKIDNNPSIGNKKGGLTTIYEKSLGAIAKGGSTALREVYLYAEQVKQKGFVVMDTPGFDPASVTGMVAGGANVVVFTTGRGSCFGCKPVPSIKVATNSLMYNRMIDDMDINAGQILDGEPVENVGREIFEKIISVASGEQTKSEAQGIGDEEFCPWSIGPVL